MKISNSVYSLAVSVLFTTLSFGQQVTVRHSDSGDTINILIGNKPFTSFCYSPALEKPVLFPVYAPNGEIVTGGFPAAPRKGERVDHPHQMGLWFNHGDVNGLDFWNNSSAIPAADKDKYGHISVIELLKYKGGKKGIIKVVSDWMNSEGVVELRETTTWIFSGKDDIWTIDHISDLKALRKDVIISDCKEGLFAIRVDRSLEMPADEALVFTDAKGNPTEVKAVDNTGVTGMYHSADGKSGNAVWGTRNKWVVLSGMKNGKPLSLAIFDNPSNPGYPAYWHARGYGLFSVNNFGRKSYDDTQEKMEVKISAGKSIRLVHRFCVKSGSEITGDQAEQRYKDFTVEYR